MSAIQRNPHFFIPYLILLFLGAVLFTAANGTVGVVLVIVLMFVLGMACVLVFFGTKRINEVLAFIYTFCTCVFFGGLAQTYSLLVFDNLQSTVDAATFFFPRIVLEAPFPAPSIDVFFSAYELAITIWQQIYIISWHFALDGAPYIGVVFNAVIVALTASLAVNTARYAYGDDTFRLHRVAVLFSVCGIFILFGATLLRDCFVVLLNTAVLWGFVKFLTAPKMKNLLIMIVIGAFSIFCMISLRFETIYLFAAYFPMAFIFWLGRRRVNVRSLTAVVIGLIFLIYFSEMLFSYLDLLLNTQKARMETYILYGANESSQDSLGMQFVVNQSIPVRTFTGVLAMIIYPIPSWRFFYIGASDLHWLVGLYGIFKIALIPSVTGSAWLILKSYWNNRRDYTVSCFLVVYFLFNLVVIVLTTAEQRHLGPFMVAFILLSVFWDRDSVEHKKTVMIHTKCWYAGVLIIHMLWISFSLLRL